jgi:hypothetical protein
MSNSKVYVTGADHGGITNTLTTMKGRSELRLASLVETDNLTVENRTLDVYTCSDVLGQFPESFVDVPLA